LINQTKRFNSSSPLDLLFWQSGLFNVGSGFDGDYSKRRKKYFDAEIKEKGQFNNFYSLQHLNYDRDVNENDLDHHTGQIKVVRGYRHPFDYALNNVNYTANEFFNIQKELVGDIY